MNTDGFPIPDLILRDAYLAVAKEVKAYREKFVAETRNVEMVRFLCGPQYAHVRVDEIRDRIPTCCKNPEKHGGGWRAKGGHGPGKGVKPSPRWYQEYLNDDWWKSFKGLVLRFWEHRCALCNSNKNIDVHHRTYERLHEEKISDCIALCRSCHKRHHKWIESPSDWKAASTRALFT